ncbi:uncharacterized protein LOC135224271 [Macrobrachium nipponense]|uniref:uncharacterized protein LOC135224271 n=1 Tax=Macrobrachium nipponense TaxID=159736 RepID=UPI0030C7ED01
MTCCSANPCSNISAHTALDSTHFQLQLRPDSSHRQPRPIRSQQENLSSFFVSLVEHLVALEGLKTPTEADQRDKIFLLSQYYIASSTGNHRLSGKTKEDLANERPEPPDHHQNVATATNKPPHSTHIIPSTPTTEKPKNPPTQQQHPQQNLTSQQPRIQPPPLQQQQPQQHRHQDPDYRQQKTPTNQRRNPLHNKNHNKTNTEQNIPQRPQTDTKPRHKQTPTPSLKTPCPTTPHQLENTPTSHPTPPNHMNTPPTPKLTPATVVPVPKVSTTP